jgi:hypothetical protein
MVPVSSYVYLAERGIRFNFGVQGDVAQSLQKVERFEAEAPAGSLAAVEGFNEINNFPVQYEGLKGVAAGMAAQRAIYARVHGDTALAGVPVYDLTGYDSKDVATRANAADFANAHVYPQNGEQPGWNANGDTWIAWNTDGLRKFRLPLVITEFGYFSIPQSGWYQIGVDEPAQAKGVINGLMDAARAGVARTYVYELLDEKPDPQNRNGEMHYGLFRNDHSPKAAAFAIRNLTSILGARRAQQADRAMAGSLPDSAACTVTGLPVSGRSLLLEQGDGRFVLVLWNETPFWNRASGTPVSSPPAHVEIDFGATVSRIDLYDPTVSVAPFTGQRNVRRIAVDVPDHPLLIEVTQASPA